MQYVVQAGDTLSSIAQRFNTTIEAIIRVNNITNPNLIFVGQVLIIPTGSSPTPPPPPPPSTICPRLSQGDRGPAVTRLQALLKNAGFDPGPADGIFGPRTDAAVRAFQRQRGLPVTGIVDIPTWVALGENCGVTPGPPPPPPPPPEECHCPVLRPGRRGPAVRLLQRLLQERGFYSGAIDGDFGRRTERAVRQFQRQQGLPVTGVVDETTWRALGVNCCPLEPKPPTGTPIDTKVVRGLRLILFTDKRVYQRGESIKITLTKTNTTDDPITLRYPTSQIIEITATNAQGNVVWRWSEGRTFAQFQRVITIFEGGTQVITEFWNQLDNNGRQVPPGTYTITVRNLVLEVTLSVQIEIR